MKSLALLLLALVIQAGVATAADGAKFRAIGFSKDARYFAFEQYGVQDGSGFAYADVFVLDTQADSWLSGTPVRTLLEDETMDVSQVRAKAKADSEKYLKQAAITVDPELLASNPFTEVVQNRKSITFHDHYNFSMGLFGDPNDQGTWTISLSDVKVPLNEGCEEDLGFFGFKLDLKNNKSGKLDVLHEDKSVPKSRYCPSAYDLEAIVQPVGGDQLVAIVGVYSRGFEGADRRFIAVPFKFN
jgi:predicted secreted protein